MRLLFDFISIQGYINGGSEHARKVLDALISSSTKVELFGLYDSKMNFVEDDYEQYSKIFSEWIDIRTIKNLGEYIRRSGFDVFYIGIFQRYENINLDSIECKTVVIIHDILTAEFLNNNLFYLYKPIKWGLANSLYRFLNSTIESFSAKSICKYGPIGLYEKHSNFLLKDNVHIITVSDFSKQSIIYNLPFLVNKEIKVFYAPLKITPGPQVNLQIKSILDKGDKYYLLLCADRFVKNAKMVIDVMKRYCSERKGIYLVTTGIEKKYFDNHIPLSFIGKAELEYAYKNAEALIYPSIVEGFGYPPIEAMKYGTPIICSNTSSIPEVVGNVGIYFSPILRSDLYHKLNLFAQEELSVRKDDIIRRYEAVNTRQEKDLGALVNYIIQ